MCLLLPVSFHAGDCGHNQFSGDHVADVSELQGNTQRETHTHTLPSGMLTECSLYNEPLAV